ncbi:MAG: AAA family ATPase [Candidatus Symbiobacter sp.]|nr:AAA family ATPase [Candidatus Symbiobacter sp.]
MNETGAESPRPVRTPVARIVSLRVKNFRCLKDVTLDFTGPLTVLVGPNGSGKSTILQVLGFISFLLRFNLEETVKKFGTLRELKSLGGQAEPIVIDIEQTLDAGYEGDEPNQIWHIELDEIDGKPFISREWAKTLATGNFTYPSLPEGKYFDFERNIGKCSIPKNGINESIISNSLWNSYSKQAEAVINEYDKITNAQIQGGQILHNEITFLQLSYILKLCPLAGFFQFVGSINTYMLTPEIMKKASNGSIENWLNEDGSNLPNFLLFWQNNKPHIFDKLIATLQKLIPQFDSLKINARDDIITIEFKDKYFKENLPGRYMSDGTLRLLAILAAVYWKSLGFHFIAFEEPENYIYPKFVPDLIEIMREEGAKLQTLLTTHSPLLLNHLSADEVRVIGRGKDGFTQIWNPADDQLITDLENGNLGDLWLEGHGGFGDALRNLNLRSRNPKQKNAKT